jgi:hypothetical protein
MRRGRVTIEMRRALRREALRDRESEQRDQEDHELAAAAHGCCAECLEEMAKGHAPGCGRRGTGG